VNCKYWIMLDWAGGPLKSDSEHKGWYEIESFSLDISSRGGPKIRRRLWHSDFRGQSLDDPCTHSRFLDRRS
jgi:hypothetical protein